jgi:hypothetical protein
LLLSTAVLEMWKASIMAFSLCQMLTLGAIEAIAACIIGYFRQLYLGDHLRARHAGVKPPSSARRKAHRDRAPRHPCAT